MEIFLLACGLLLFGSAILLVQNYRKIRQFKQALEKNQSELINASEQNQALMGEIKTLENKLQRSFEDPVTGLIGWEIFEDRLHQNISESARYHFNSGILAVDIDNFKMINNALSHEIGDLILKEVANRLASCTRQVDSLTRASEDTFIVLLAQLTKPEMASVVAQRMLQLLQQPFHIHDYELYITAGIGIAIYPTDGDNIEKLLASAQQALDLAKEKGTHIYQFYQAELQNKSRRELALHTSLSNESIFQTLVLYYQPILDQKNNILFCLDSLLHWQHPELGLINPAGLFNYAEKQRKLNVISEWMLRQACQQFVKWKNEENAPKYLGIPVMLHQLESTQFIYQISQILQELSLAPSSLLLAIKSGRSHLSYSVLQKSFNRLKYLGVKIAIDNFGLDSLALGHLKDIPINYLKLDPILITDVTQNPKAHDLLKSILDLAKNLSMEVIAQGVETKDQAKILKELGCFLLEGHFVAPALPAEKLFAATVVTE